jgi:hypothetical protein
VSTAEPPSFDELLDQLRVRLGIADDVNATESHSFKELMKDKRDVISDQWYHRAFDELQAQGHLDPGASRKAMAFEAWGRLSADGRLSQILRGTRPLTLLTQRVCKAR